MSGISIETTLELWASSLRDVKARMRPLFSQDRVAASASSFLGRKAIRVKVHGKKREHGQLPTILAASTDV